MKSFIEKYSGWVVLCGMFLSLLGWGYWYINRPVGDLTVILTVSKTHKEIKKNSLAEVVTAQFARENLKVRGQSPKYTNEDGVIRLRYTRLPQGNVKEKFEIPKCAEEVVDATIKEGEVEKRLELFHPPEKLTLINETGSDLKILRIRSGTIKEKTTAVDKDLAAEGSLDLEKSYREGRYPETGKERTILVLKRDGFRELEVPVIKTPFPITAALFEGKEEQAVVKLQFNEATTLHNTTNFYGFIRDEIKPAVKISAMNKAGQWEENDVKGEPSENTTNSTVTLSYRNVPIGVKSKLQVAIEYKYYEKFITNSVPRVDGDEWILTAGLECIKPKVTITPSIETKIDGPKGESYPLRISIQNKARDGSQSAAGQKIETPPCQFTLEPFAEYQLIIDGEGVQKSTHILPIYLPGTNSHNYSVTVAFEAEKEERWLELHKRIIAEAGAMQTEFEEIEKAVNINMAQALDQLENFTKKYEPLILAKAFEAKKKSTRSDYFPPESPKYKRYIDIEGEVIWDGFNTALMDVEKLDANSKNGEERLDKLQSDIEKAYQKVKAQKIMEGEDARKGFDNDGALDRKQILTKFIEPDWYEKDFKLPTKEHLESDPLDYLEKLEEAKDLLDTAYHKALDREFKAYQKGLGELKKDLDKLREGNQINIQGADEQKKIEEFMDQAPGAPPKSENFHTWMDRYIRTPCKLLYQELIRAELNIIEQKREVDPGAFDLQLKGKVTNFRENLLPQIESRVQSLYEEPEAYKELKVLRVSYKAYKDGYLKKVNEKMGDPKADLKEVWEHYGHATNHFPNAAKGFNWGDKLKTEVSLTEVKGRETEFKIGIPQGVDGLEIAIDDGETRQYFDLNGVKKRSMMPGQHRVEISYSIKGKKVEYATLMEMEGPAVELNIVKDDANARPIIIAGKFEPFRRINVEGMKGILFNRDGKGKASVLIEIDEGEHYQDLNQVDQVEIDVEGDMLRGFFDSTSKPTLNFSKTKIMFWVKLSNTPKEVTVNKLKSSAANRYTAHFSQPSGSSEPLKSRSDNIAGNAAEKRKKQKNNSGTENTPSRAAAEVGAIISFDPKFGFYVINRGSDHGIKAAQEFNVIRAGRLVGKIKIEQPQPTVSIAKALKEFTSQQFQPGDKLIKSD